MLINDETEIDISFNQLNPQIRRLLSQAVQGKDVVSPVFYESGFKCDVIVYGVPVFESNGTVQGVVCGVKDLERFKEKIDGPSISNVKLDVAWITFEGEWICSFQNNMLRQSGENIFENPNISKQEREHLKNAMEDQQVYQVQLNTQDGVAYSVFSASRNEWVVFALCGQYPYRTQLDLSHFEYNQCYYWFNDFVVHWFYVLCASRNV